MFINQHVTDILGSTKYTPAYPSKPFETLEVARRWVHGFVRWYNAEHRHSAIRYVTPNERHAGADGELLRQRKAVYEAAKARNPQRWSGNTRDWSPVESVWLNPPKEHQAEKGKRRKAA